MVLYKFCIIIIIIIIKKHNRTWGQVSTSYWTGYATRITFHLTQPSTYYVGSSQLRVKHITIQRNRPDQQQHGCESQKTTAKKCSRWIRHLFGWHPIPKRLSSSSSESRSDRMRLSCSCRLCWLADAACSWSTTLSRSFCRPNYSV